MKNGRKNDGSVKIRRNGKLRLFVQAAVLLALIAYCILENNVIDIDYFSYVSTEVPDCFNGFTIVHVSDLHNKLFGNGQEYLLQMIREQNPDVIFVTGDLIDRRKYDLEVAIEFMRGAVLIAPTFYVPGNHEAWSNRYDDVRFALMAEGINVLEDSSVRYEKDSQAITILGLVDPGFPGDSMTGKGVVTQLQSKLKQWSNIEGLTLLLSHRPELFDRYCAAGVDAVFAGHAHGGQVRLPLIGGLYAPNQGIFPKYTEGAYQRGETTMYVSRGLGNSIIPIRIFNRPELIVVKLHNR